MFGTWTLRVINMDPDIWGLIGPVFLNQVPTLTQTSTGARQREHTQKEVFYASVCGFLG